LAEDLQGLLHEPRLGLDARDGRRDLRVRLEGTVRRGVPLEQAERWLRPNLD